MVNVAVVVNYHYAITTASQFCQSWPVADHKGMDAVMTGALLQSIIRDCLGELKGSSLCTTWDGKQKRQHWVRSALYTDHWTAKFNSYPLQLIGNNQ